MAEQQRISDEFRWLYVGKVERVVDGDTVDMLIDLGFSTWRKERIRLDGIDTPERGQPGFTEAGQFLRKLTEGREVIIETIKDKRGKFGRYLGRLHVQNGESIDDVNQMMLDAGHAKPYGK